jgi:hypothetical protein
MVAGGAPHALAKHQHVYSHQHGKGREAVGNGVQRQVAQEPGGVGISEELGDGQRAAVHLS